MKRYVIAFGAMILLLGGLFFFNIGSGSVKMTGSEIADILLHRFGSTADETARQIVWEIRLPRICAAVILGGALSVAGFLLQSFFQNPIAGPYVLGISSGAKLVVALTMITLLEMGRTISSLGMIVAAFAGSMLAMGFVLLISCRVKKMSMLVVCGIMIGYICSAITDFCVTFADDSNIVNLHNWSMGSLSGMTWSNVRMMTAVVAITMGVTFFLAKPIGAYQMGEAYARNMGVKIRLLRVLLILESAVCLRDGLCRTDLLCGNCGSASGEDGDEDGETASADTGLFSGRGNYHAVLRRLCEDGVCSDGAFDQFGDSRIPGAGSDCDDAAQE